MRASAQRSPHQPGGEHDDQDQDQKAPHGLAIIAKMKILVAVPGNLHTVRMNRFVPDALVALVKHRPALIILDLMMPGVDGAQFRQAQRRLQDHELANVPILVVSGVDNAKQMAKTLGAAGIFEKPLDLDRIVAAVQARVSTVAS